MERRIDRESEARSAERADRVLAVLTPLFTRDTVRRIIRREFPQNTETEVCDILKGFNSESEELSCQVHLDSIKLSEGSLAKLQQLVELANLDFRDVILPAENPRLLNMDFVAYADSSEDEEDRITNEDLNDYVTWIQKP